MHTKLHCTIEAHTGDHLWQVLYASDLLRTPWWQERCGMPHSGAEDPYGFQALTTGAPDLIPTLSRIHPPSSHHDGTVPHTVAPLTTLCHLPNDATDLSRLLLSPPPHQRDRGWITGDQITVWIAQLRGGHQAFSTSRNAQEATLSFLCRALDVLHLLIGNATTPGFVGSPITAIDAHHPAPIIGSHSRHAHLAMVAALRRGTSIPLSQTRLLFCSDT